MVRIPLMSALGPPEAAGHRDAAFGLWEAEKGLLLVRNARLLDGRATPTWDLPGGAARTGEGLVKALQREWREETGLDVDVGPLLFVVHGSKRRAIDAPPLYTWRAFVFKVRSEGKPTPGDGIDELTWIARSKAPAYLTAPYHEALRGYLQGNDATYATCVWVEPLPAEDGSGKACDGAPTAEADRLRRLLAIAACAAAGATGLVAREVAAAREEGVADARIAETLLQVVPYAGFPRTIAAFTANDELVSDTDSPFHPFGEEETGRATFADVYGDTAERVARGLERLHPELRRWTHRFAYGTVLARPVLSLLERELLAVSILTALGKPHGPAPRAHARGDPPRRHEGRRRRRDRRRPARARRGKARRGPRPARAAVAAGPVLSHRSGTHMTVAISRPEPWTRTTCAATGSRGCRERRPPPLRGCRPCPPRCASL